MEPQIWLYNITLYDIFPWYFPIYSQIIPTPRGQGTAEWKARRAMCGGVQCAAIVEKKPVVSVWMGSEKHAERFGMHTYEVTYDPFCDFYFGISKETGNEVVLLTTLMWAALQKDLAKFLWFFHAFQTLRHRVPPTQAMSAAMLIHVDSFSWHFAAFCSVLQRFAALVPSSEWSVQPALAPANGRSRPGPQPWSTVIEMSLIFFNAFQSKSVKELSITFNNIQ